MRKFIKYTTIVLAFAGMVACNMLEPVDENRLTIDYIGSDPETAEGILLQGYTSLNDQFIFSEAGTDDAVNNQQSNGYKRMANGELTAQYNPASNWTKYEKVFYLNQFIDIVEEGEVLWNRDAEINELFNERLKGEALALRGLYHFYVLQAHAGKSASGELLGIQYFTEFIGSDGDFNLPRLSFEATVEAIMADFDEALDLLPTDYSDSEADVDAKYSNVDFEKYKVVNGSQYDLRISGRIVKALKARLALFAASPSFLNGAGYYEIAANLSSEVLSTIGGTSGLVAGGVEFYTSDNGKDSGEMLWRGSIGSNSSTYEARMFPPSVNGKGEINPTHNLVMAFPMKSGLPATEENGFDPQNPYANRDPRLAKYIVLNGSSFGGGTINTGFGGGIDRLDSISEQSTTTGYYLKKLLRPDVRINNDGSTVGKPHYDVYFRYTELFLILAEAANEIGGPNYSVNGISAMDVISAIRKRAGITQPDAYLATVSTKEAMRELIRNERRLELCFEGHRFWDLRRWGLSLTETAKGYFHDGTAYVEIPAVETRNYPSYATYMPIPYQEVLKYSELVQNSGW
ncbi:RagB/SusD family nutrient uptake outer membrane protein [Mangrovibacterium sp.]|uniref:RagB/SusD family nutrient uptake outer membrane protein n=1 Tax=Mangrovibacterium sp. TaxID=1961364 RepID=UPI003565A75E